MIPGRILNATAVLGAPQGWDGLTDLPCDALPVRFEILDGLPAFASAWIPTPDELAALQAGAPVILRVVGTGQPPVQLSVGEPPREP